MESTQYQQYNLRSVTITNATSNATSSMQMRSGTTVYHHDSGTGTTAHTRNFAQQPQNIPTQVQYHVSTSSGYTDTWGFQNPQTPGQFMDAGHMMPRSGGGRGDLATNIYGQDRDINRGWNGTFGQHRSHERDFVAEARKSETYKLQHKAYK